MLGLWEFNYTTWPAIIQTMTASMTLTTFDSTGASGVNKNYVLAMQGSTSTAYSAQAVATGGTTFTLPLATVNFIYVKNTGNFPVTVTWTPYGGSPNVVMTLQPGGFVFDGNSAVGSGITSLSMQAVGGNSTVDCVLFG